MARPDGASWPVDGGATGRLIRARDWAATALGPVAGWPQSLRTAVDICLAAPEPTTILWGAGRIQLYNDAYAAVARVRHPAMFGRPALENWAEDRAALAPVLDRLFAGGGAVVAADRPVASRAADGATEGRTYTFTFSAIRDEAGAVGGVFHRAIETTPRTRAVAEREGLLAAERAARAGAEEAVRARDTFLSIAAHELKTPLTSLRGGAQLLARQQARGLLDPARLATGLDALVRATDRLAALIDDLLDVAHLRTGRLPLALRPVDLVALVGAAVAQARERAEGHRLTLAAPADLPPLLADPGRVEQVLTNVLDNALKYSPGGGAVAVTVAAAGAGATVAVRDAGIGLPPGAAEAIFAPFGRAANAATSNLPGMGLGLAICRDIVARHGGWIRAASDGEGRGATVAFWLPTAGPAAVAGAE